MPNCSRACARPRARSNSSTWCRRRKRARVSSGISISRRLRPRRVPLAARAHARARARRGGRGRCAAVRPLQCGRLRAARGRQRSAPATATPKIFRLNAEVIACGDAPALEVAPGTATTIATGGVIPRGADAVVMIEQTELIEQARRRGIELRRAAAPGQFISYAGSDIARGETLLRRGTRIGSREIGMLAACGLGARRRGAAAESGGAVDRRRTGGAGQPLKPAGVYDSNGAIIAAAVREAGGEPIAFGAFPDDAAALEKAVRRALAESDMVVLSGGTSKGAGDLSHHRVAARHARHSGAWRRAQARQAALPRRHRRQRRSWCCRAFRPRRSSPSMLSSRR